MNLPFSLPNRIPTRCLLASCFLAVSLSSCAYEAPLDPDYAGTLNSVEGTVVFAGDLPPGPVFVALYDADNPPPPAGTGGPVTFAGVPADAFTGDGAGLQSAQWSITRVPDGEYLVSGLMDMDGDFQPRLVSNAGGTCGDWRGGHLVDLSSATPAPVTLEGGEFKDDVTVLVASPYTAERPAFRFTENAIVRSADEDENDPFVDIEAEGIYSSLITLEGPFDGAAEDAADSCETAFWVTVVDEDGDGLPDLHWLVRDMEEPPAGAYAIWPRIYAEYIPAEGELEDGERFVTELVVFPSFLFDGSVPVNTPTPFSALTGVYAGLAIHILPDGTQVTIADDDDDSNVAIPAGDWSTTVVASTGQTWRVPNETAIAPTTDPDWESASQGAVLQLQ
jgi:hypothetical protein